MPKSSLSDSQKQRIYQLKKDGFPQRKIAELYEVSQGTISNAIRDQAHKEEIEMYRRQQENAMIRGVTAAVETGEILIDYIDKK